MSRNNSRRNKIPQNKPTQTQNMPSMPAAPPHTGMTFVVPTELVDLPSRGKPYKEGSSLQGMDKVEIKHMTAKEEDVLVNKDYISRGIVLDKLIESVLINKNIKVDDIEDVDKIAILVNARRTGYGDDYEYNIHCENCNSEQKFTFNLQKLISNAMQESQEVPEGVTFNQQDETFSMTLPVSKHRVLCRILGTDMQKYISELEESRKKHSIEFNYTIEFLRQSIIEVVPSKETSNGLPITDPETISQFLDFIPALDSRKIKIAHAALIPGFRMHEEVSCPNCGHTAEREVPFSWAWFWNN